VRRRIILEIENELDEGLSKEEMALLELLKTYELEFAK